jgi:hypothetical protein
MRDERRTPWFHRVLGGVLCLAFALAGCAPLAGPALPAAVPTAFLPTAIALTVAAGRPRQVSPTDLPPSTYTPTLPYTSTPGKIPPSQTSTRSATIGPSVTPTWRRITLTPTITPTPALPFATIQILSPGPASRVISPIKVSAYLEPGAKGNVTFELIGEDGRLLVRTIKTYYAGTRVHANLDIEYEIAAAAEAARLLISTRDGYGRINALASVDLLLLSIGDPDLSLPGDTLQNIIIREPRPKALIQGGTVWISGLARTGSPDPLIVEMINRDGQPVGPTKLVNRVESEYPGFSAFSAEIPYSVKTPTWVLLVVSELTGRIPGVTHLASLEVLLSP